MAISMGLRPNIYTIGHSNHSLEAFLELLKGHLIDVVVDTRTQPYSAYSPHFTRRPLEDALAATGFKYLFLGKELGGRPEGSEFYDDDGRLLYYQLAESPLFLAGVARLENGMANYRIALLCSEEDPQVCHRQLLVGRVLSRRGVVIHHIRGDGRIERSRPKSRPSDAPRHSFPSARITRGNLYDRFFKKDLMVTPTHLTSIVRQVVSLLANGEYDKTVAECFESRLSPGDLQQVIKQYGRTFIVPPADAYASLDVVAVVAAPIPTWSIRAPLWSKEEGRSDLTLELSIAQDEERWIVELDDLHVL